MACAGLLGAPALAQEALTPAIQLNGFGTIGLSHAHTNFGGTFARDVSQVPGAAGVQLKPDSRLGIQGNFQLTDQLELVGQVVAKPRAAAQPDSDAVEWAFASYRPTRNTTLRAGRLGTDIYMLSDYQNVGIGYTMARPPVDFYGVLATGSLDGVDVTHTWPTDDGQWKLKGFLGQSTYQTSVSSNPFKDIGGLMLARETHGLMVRGTYAKGRVQMNYPDIGLLRNGLSQLANATQLVRPNVASQARELLSAIDLSNVHVKYLTIGLAYDQHDWVAQAEVMRIHSNSSIAPGQGGYVMLGRRLGSWTPYVSLSRLKSQGDPYAVPDWGRELMPLAPILGADNVAAAQLAGRAVTALLNGLRVDQSTVSLGARWDVTPTSALKFQVDRVKVRPLSTLLWQGRATGGRAWVGSVVLDFTF